MLASGSVDGIVILWGTQSGQQIGELLRGQNYLGVSTIAFSPNGKILAVAGRYDTHGGTVILWDTQSRQQLREPLRGQSYLGVSTIAFSPNGKMLASGGDDGSVILWDVDIDSWKERACRIANRNLTRSEWTQYLGNEPYHKTCPNVPEGR
jgi:WD40 repeat protein